MNETGDDKYTCVASCDSHEYIMSNGIAICSNCSQKGLNATLYPVNDQDDYKICTAQCSTLGQSYYFFDPNNDGIGECTQNCSNTNATYQFYNTTAMVCQRKCDSNLFLNSTGAFICIDECENAYPIPSVADIEPIDNIT